MNPFDNIRDLRTLVLLHKAGHRPKLYPFWKGGFSQWSRHPIVEGAYTYPTAEHYMMAHKARLFGDAEAHLRIMSSLTPKDAKWQGRRVKKFDEFEWERARWNIVVNGNTQKFLQHKELRAELLSTCGSVLVEASPFDQIWGAGIDSTDARFNQPDQWPGINLLGFALMEVRSRLIGI